MIVQCPDCKKELVEFDPGSGNYHCSNPSCDFQYLEIATGKEFRRDKMAEPPLERPSGFDLDKRPKKILIGLAIESTLLSMGGSMFDKVTARLREDYNANVFDCLDSPKYLRKVLEKYFDKTAREVVAKSIKSALGEFAYYESVREFLEEIGGIK